ncbi:MAG: transposase [Planctomycetes bacterium]|nr:transposase [Planctomycetota bacterium]
MASSFALVVIAELGEVERFRRAKQLGSYAGLSCRMHQSGTATTRGGRRSTCRGS